MKLYILKHKKDIIAISESKSDMEIFILQCNFHLTIYSVEKIKDNKKINKILNQYYDYYLHEYEGVLLPDKDIMNIKRIVQEHRKKIKETIESLKLFNSEFNMSINNHKDIKKCIDILEYNNKKKNIGEFINMHEIVRVYFTCKEISEMFNTYNEIFDDKY